jgi:hypothetical protein
MKILQLSLFAENKPGHLFAPCRLLADHGINLKCLSLADTQKFGILRILVSEPERAMQVLQAAGHVVKTTEVLAIEVPNQPGGLVGVLSALEGSSVNIDYVYASPFGRDGKAVLIFRFDDPDAAVITLQAAGLNVLGGADFLKD